MLPVPPTVPRRFAYPRVRPLASPPPPGPGFGSLVACVAAILEIDVADVPGGDGLSRWLGVRGLGLCEVSDPVTFAWPGPWIAYARAQNGRTGCVVRSGVPSGNVHDPAGLGATAVLTGGLLLAPHDPLRHLLAPGGPAADVDEDIRLASAVVAPVFTAAPVRADTVRGLQGHRYALG